MSFLYFIKPLKSRSLMKFGRTVDLKRRVSQHKSEWPDLELIGFIRSDDANSVEHKVKAATRAIRTHGREIIDMDIADISKVLNIFRFELFVAGGSWNHQQYVSQIKEITRIFEHFVTVATYREMRAA